MKNNLFKILILAACFYNFTKAMGDLEKAEISFRSFGLHLTSDLKILVEDNNVLLIQNILDKLKHGIKEKFDNLIAKYYGVIMLFPKEPPMLKIELKLFRKISDPEKKKRVKFRAVCNVTYKINESISSEDIQIKNLKDELDDIITYIKKGIGSLLEHILIPSNEEMPLLELVFDLDLVRVRE